MIGGGMLEVLDSEKQSRRWVEEKIKSYDPETEYAEIVSLMAQYQLDEFTLNFLVTILTSYTLKPAHMAETLSITNKGLRRPNQRMQDTLDFFWIWHVYGPDAEETKKSISRLNNCTQGSRACCQDILKMAMILYTCLGGYSCCKIDCSRT